MTLPAPLARVQLALRQAWDVFWTGGTTASSSAIWAWDAAKSGSRLKNWWAPSLDFTSYANPDQLRARARDVARNNPWGARITNLMRDYVVGTGVRPLISLPDASLRQLVSSKWGAWVEQADYNGFHSFYGLQAAAFKATLIDGECIVLIHPGDVLKVQLLGSEFFSRQNDDATWVGGGVVYDDAGRRTGYMLYDKLPQRALVPIPRFVEADRVAHCFLPQQLGFERGTSFLAPALTALWELQGFSESALVRARTSSLFCGFVRSADGSQILQNDDGSTTFEPGSIARLRPGDELQFTSPPDPSAAFDPFIRCQLRAIASSLGIPYELCSGDLTNVTFASGRHALIAFERTIDALQQNLVAYTFCRPIWNWWLKIEVAKGELPEEVLTAPTRWIGPEFQMLDSRASTLSTTQKIRSGLMSLSEAIRSNGADPQGLFEEIASDNAMIDKLKLTLDSDPRKTTLQGQEQPTQPSEATNANIQ